MPLDGVDPLDSLARALPPGVSGDSWFMAGYRGWWGLANGNTNKWCWVVSDGGFGTDGGLGIEDGLFAIEAAARHNPINLTVNQGYHAQDSKHTRNIRTWYTGVANNGEYHFFDQSAGRHGLILDTGGHAHFAANVNANAILASNAIYCGGMYWQNADWMYTPWRVQSAGRIYAGGNLNGHDVVARNSLWVGGAQAWHTGGWGWTLNAWTMVPTLQVGGLQCENSGGNFYFHNALHVAGVYVRNSVDIQDLNLRNQVLANRLYSHGNFEGQWWYIRAHLWLPYGIAYTWLNAGHYMGFLYVHDWLGRPVCGLVINNDMNGWGVVLCDERVKRGIHPSGTDALAAINGLQHYDFNRVFADELNIPEKQFYCGVIAQQVETVMPDVIDEPKRPPLAKGPIMKSLRMQVCAGYMTRAIQQLSERLEALEEELDGDD
jgi:hypothetical protein